MLAPSLKPGDIVVLDNLSADKVAGVREAIEAVGARLLYLPPYRIAGLLEEFPSDERANYFRHAGYASC